MRIGKPGKLSTLPHTEAMHTAAAGNGFTLQDLLGAPHERGRIGLLILLLTLTAAWIDMLSYLSLGRVFASFRLWRGGGRSAALITGAEPFHQRSQRSPEHLPRRFPCRVHRVRRLCRYRHLHIACTKEREQEQANATGDAART